MSQALQATEIRAETGVVGRSQFSQSVHRPDPDAEEPRPACQEAGIEHAEEYREVSIAAVVPHRSPCQNPACFGAADQGGRHIWRGSLADRPLRMQAYHVSVVAATHGETPLTLSDVQALLAVDSTERSLQRGLRDASDAGWLEWDAEAREWRQGPLAAALRGGERP